MRTLFFEFPLSSQTFVASIACRKPMCPLVAWSLPSGCKMHTAP